ncbi:MAG TPA: DUF302 domain-containing protein [Longimicrobiales bacterium]|nr:DUF302 domain-containing protein [Longimicrobiales bacterium]
MSYDDQKPVGGAPTTQSLGFELRLDVPFDEAIERVSQALREQGFGILTRIDVRSTLKEKLDVDFRDYVILGACNPKLAHRALSARPDVGLLLPCNVTVEKAGDAVVVRIANPEAMMATGGFEDDAAIVSVAAEARGLLRLAAESLERPPGA